MVFNNSVIIAFGFTFHAGVNNPKIVMTLPITYKTRYIPLFTIQTANTTAPNTEGNPRANIVDLATVCFNSNVNAYKEGFYWITIGS